MYDLQDGYVENLIQDSELEHLLAPYEFPRSFSGFGVYPGLLGTNDEKHVVHYGILIYILGFRIRRVCIKAASDQRKGGRGRFSLSLPPHDPLGCFSRCTLKVLYNRVPFTTLSASLPCLKKMSSRKKSLPFRQTTIALLTAKRKRARPHSQNT